MLSLYRVDEPMKGSLMTEYYTNKVILKGQKNLGIMETMFNKLLTCSMTF